MFAPRRRDLENLTEFGARARAQIDEIAKRLEFDDGRHAAARESGRELAVVFSDKELFEQPPPRRRLEKARSDEGVYS